MYIMNTIVGISMYIHVKYIVYLYEDDLIYQ